MKYYCVQTDDPCSNLLDLSLTLTNGTHYFWRWYQHTLAWDLLSMSLYGTLGCGIRFPLYILITSLRHTYFLHALPPLVAALQSMSSGVYGAHGIFILHICFGSLGFVCWLALGVEVPLFIVLSTTLVYGASIPGLWRIRRTGNLWLTYLLWQSWSCSWICARWRYFEIYWTHGWW